MHQARVRQWGKARNYVEAPELPAPGPNELRVKVIATGRPPRRMHHLTCRGCHPCGTSRPSGISTARTSRSCMLAPCPALPTCVVDVAMSLMKPRRRGKRGSVPSQSLHLAGTLHYIWPKVDLICGVDAGLCSLLRAYFRASTSGRTNSMVETRTRETGASGSCTCYRAPQAGMVRLLRA